MWDFVMDKSDAGTGFFSEYFGFPPLPIFIPPISPRSPSPIIRGWYNRPVVVAVPKVPPHKLKNKKKKQKQVDVLINGELLVSMMSPLSGYC
jgi:hypothetical protein